MAERRADPLSAMSNSSAFSAGRHLQPTPGADETGGTS